MLVAVAMSGDAQFYLRCETLFFCRPNRVGPPKPDRSKSVDVHGQTRERNLGFACLHSHESCMN